MADPGPDRAGHLYAQAVPGLSPSFFSCFADYRITLGIAGSCPVIFSTVSVPVKRELWVIPLPIGSYALVVFSEYKELCGPYFAHLFSIFFADAFIPGKLKNPGLLLLAHALPLSIAPGVCDPSAFSPSISFFLKFHPFG